jgi:hypothetical protein
MAEERWRKRNESQCSLKARQLEEMKKKYIIVIIAIIISFEDL